MGNCTKRPVRAQHRVYNQEKRKFEFLEKEGALITWMQDYEEFESGPGMFPCAVIEGKDGKVFTAAAESVCFLDVEKS